MPPSVFEIMVPANPQTPRIMMAIPVRIIIILGQSDGGFGSYGSSGIVVTFGWTDLGRGSFQDYRPLGAENRFGPTKNGNEAGVIAVGATPVPPFRTLQVAHLLVDERDAAIERRA